MSTIKESLEKEYARVRRHGWSWAYKWKNRQYSNHIVINRLIREVGSVFIVIKTKPSFLLAFTLVLLTAFGIYFFQKHNIMPIINTLGGVVFAAFALVLAIVTIVASISNESYVRGQNQQGQFVAELQTQSNVLEAVFSMATSATDRDKFVLLVGIAAQSVFDQVSYEKFKEWHGSAVHLINFSNIEPVYSEFLFPYDAARLSIEIRPYALMNAISVGEKILNHNHTQHNLQPQLNELKRIVKLYGVTDYSSYYGQDQFIGDKLSRITLYGFISLILLGMANILQDYRYNVSSMNFHLVTVSKLITLLALIFAMFLIGRYILLYVANLNSTLDDKYMFKPFDLSFYERDNTLKSPNPLGNFPGK